LENRLKRVEETDINVLFKEALNGSLKKIDGVVFGYNKAMKGARTEAKTLADILSA
jgi:adenylylsulfate kinase-like enzyme